MAFFPRNFYGSEGSFTPLFRLLDEFDNYSRTGSIAQNSSLPTWQPKFDVRETGAAYELHGELPGMNKEGVNIEFTEPQTLIIRGRAERTYTSGTPPAGLVEGGTNTAAITQGEGAAQDTASKDSSVQKSSGDKKPADKAKYWLSERSVGEFSRSFNFPTPVDHDTVSANFKDGILNITVPKAKKSTSRRIAIE